MRITFEDMGTLNNTGAIIITIRCESYGYFNNYYFTDNTRDDETEAIMFAMHKVQLLSDDSDKEVKAVIRYEYMFDGKTTGTLNTYTITNH